MWITGEWSEVIHAGLATCATALIPVDDDGLDVIDSASSSFSMLLISSISTGLDTSQQYASTQTLSGCSFLLLVPPTFHSHSASLAAPPPMVERSRRRWVREPHRRRRGLQHAERAWGGPMPTALWWTSWPCYVVSSAMLGFRWGGGSQVLGSDIL
jgi:hypothetical protein